jgi:hypothetical protein
MLRVSLSFDLYRGMLDMSQVPLSLSTLQKHHAMSSHANSKKPDGKVDTHAPVLMFLESMF